MLLLGIGVLYVIFSIVSSSKERPGIMIISFLLGLVLCYSGLFLPVSGYEEVVVQEEYNLEKIVFEENKYVIQTKDKDVKYVIKKKDAHQNEKFVMCTNSEAEIFIVKNPIRPFIRKCLVKARRTIYTFALKPAEEKYKIYVNEGNIKIE